MRIGVLLAGCGHLDGTDVLEAVLVLQALEAAGEKPVLLAPRLPQERVIDHLGGDASAGETRDMLRESARLARGPVRALSEWRPDLLEALIIPGGYGPAVNFSPGFARRGQKRSLAVEVADFIRHFLEAGKPIGLVSLGEIPVRTLLGQAIETPPPPSDPRALNVDHARRIVHTPGAAAFPRIRDVRAGIEAMVDELLRLLNGREPEPAASGRGAADPE
jgi:enhancing lycopene biosynthesis protein 2